MLPSNQELFLYEKPEVQKFGSFRSLTQIGFNNASDGATALGIGNGEGCYTGPGQYGENTLICPSAS